MLALEGCVCTREATCGCVVRWETNIHICVDFPTRVRRTRALPSCARPRLPQILHLDGLGSGAAFGIVASSKRRVRVPRA